MRSTRLSDALEEFYCGDCGNGSDGEICERCRGVTIDWSKTDRRWNGKTFWQEPTCQPEYRMAEREEKTGYDVG